MFGFKREISVDAEKIKEILTRGVEDVFVKDSLEKKLLSGKSLRIKLGFDPTGDKIHLGRAVILRKLKAFQDLGHKVVFIIGDFTAMIGDPSDKLEKRPMLTHDQIKENLRDYKNQIGKIINLKEAEFHFNSKWLSNLRFQEITELAESFSVQQMLSRRNFKERLAKGQDISLREFLYPLMQGYDSVEVEADVEIGGFDQLFNLKAGRIIQRHCGKPEQDVLTGKMLEGTDGRKMSTSWGNVINITDSANEMYGKIMSMKDELLPEYFLLCTDLPQSEINSALDGVHPKEAKMRLAKEIISLYHSSEEAESAEKNFQTAFNDGGIPDDAPVVKVDVGTKLVEAVVQHSGVISSATEFKRLVQSGAIKSVQTGETIIDHNMEIKENQALRLGKKKFLRIEV